MIKYDKLKNLDIEEESFEFICPYCEVNGMKKGMWDIKPINIAWKPDMIDNSDIENQMIRIQLNALPTLRQAILEASTKAVEGKYITIKCNSCNQHVPVYDKISVSEMRKWLNRNMEQFLDLRVNQDDRRIRK